MNLNAGLSRFMTQICDDFHLMYDPSIRLQKLYSRYCACLESWQDSELIALVCVLIQAKLEDVKLPPHSELCKVCNQRYTANDFIRKELDILQILNLHLREYSVGPLVVLLAHKNKSNVNSGQLDSWLRFISIRFYALCSFTPDELAAAVYSIIYPSQKSQVMKFTGITLEQICHVMDVFDKQARLHESPPISPRSISSRIV